MTAGLRKLLLQTSAGVALFLSAALALWAIQAATREVRARAAQPPASMAALLPQGALLTIESPDFAALLKSWNDSPEQKAWLASANYSVFSNSRLFGRLNDARTEFEAATGKGDNTVGIDSDFLTQVAGRQSIFAWYDVGKLEFVYISRMSTAQAAATALMKQHSAFSMRQAGGASFYLRHSTDSETGAARTVAFAQVPASGGTLLLLATREDLMASALELIQHGAAGAAGAQPGSSLVQEPWYEETVAALPPAGAAPALHMVLNLDRLVPMPYFRSYWVQQNISEMKQYRAAVSDLYREPQAGGLQFREERVLLVKSPESTAADSLPDAQPAALAALVPAGTGVYRARATHDSGLAVTALEEKLIGRITLAQQAPSAAPDPSLVAAAAGTTADLETFIDTPPPVSAAFSNQQLVHAIDAAGLDAMLTCSTATMPGATASAAQALWVPIHSAVVLHAASPWQPGPLVSALQQSLRGDLTTATLGIEFRPATAAAQTIYSLTGPKPLFFAVSANLFFVADDRELLLALLQQAARPVRATAQPALQIAAFDHTSQRAPYHRLTSLIDGTNRQQPESAPASAESAATPAYFSQNLGSLSDAFAALSSERFVERRDGPNLRQTVTYQWQRP